MDVDTACDTLGYVLDTDVRDTLRELSASLKEGQTLTGAYLDHKLRSQDVGIAAFAEACGIARSFLYRVINGEKGLSEELLRTMAQQDAFTLHELLAVQAVQKFLT